MSILLGRLARPLAHVTGAISVLEVDTNREQDVGTVANMCRTEIGECS